MMDILQAGPYSILDLISEGESRHYLASSAGPMSKEQKNRLHFIRTGGRDCLMKNQRKDREAQP